MCLILDEFDFYIYIYILGVNDEVDNEEDFDNYNDFEPWEPF